MKVATIIPIIIINGTNCLPCPRRWCQNSNCIYYVVISVDIKSPLEKQMTESRMEFWPYSYHF